MSNGKQNIFSEIINLKWVIQQLSGHDFSFFGPPAHLILSTFLLNAKNYWKRQNLQFFDITSVIDQKSWILFSSIVCFFQKFTEALIDLFEKNRIET